MKVVLIRHGQTEGNTKNLYIGHTDEPLIGAGKEGLNTLVSEKLYPDVLKVYSSPMKRCLQTAEIIYPAHKPVILEDLREINFGSFEGYNYNEIIKMPEFSETWYGDNNYVFPKGENVKAFFTRCVNVFFSLEDNENIGIITHGGVIMAIMTHLFNRNMYEFYVKNGRGFIVFTENNKLSYELL